MLTAAELYLFLLFYVPLLRDIFTEYPLLQRQFKFPIIKGFIQVKVLGFFIVYLCQQALNSPGFSLVFSTAVMFIGAFLSETFFIYRKEKLGLKFGTEKYFMNSFYKNLIYGFIIIVPAIPFWTFSALIFWL